MRKLILLLLWLTASLLPAAVINVEFKFTPFVGDPTRGQTVRTVAGKAAVFINNVLLAEQEVRDDEAPVLFEEHEIAAAVWVPMSSVGPSTRGRVIARSEMNRCGVGRVIRTCSPARQRGCSSSASASVIGPSG